MTDDDRLINGLRRIRVAVDDAAAVASRHGSGGATMLAESVKGAIDELLSGGDIMGPGSTPLTPDQQGAFDRLRKGGGGA